jgi:hypothetical protein
MKIWVCLDRIDPKDGNVWAVREGNRWHTTKQIQIDIPLHEGPSRTIQPKAFFVGQGQVTRRGELLIVHA